MYMSGSASSTVWSGSASAYQRVVSGKAADLIMALGCRHAAARPQALGFLRRRARAPTTEPERAEDARRAAVEVPRPEPPGIPGSPASTATRYYGRRRAVRVAGRELRGGGIQAARTPLQPSPPPYRLGEIAPEMVRPEAEVKQVTHAIRMSACKAETTLARALDGRYARVSDEAYA